MKVIIEDAPLLPDMMSPTPPYFPLTDSSMFLAAPKFSNSVYGSKDCVSYLWNAAFKYEYNQNEWV